MRGALAGLAALFAATVHAGVTLDGAWMRPAHEGQASAEVYVDIRATGALTLVGASMPVARRAELVLAAAPDAPAATQRVVAALPIAADARTRLALGGSHVRLLEVTRDVLPGERLPLELAFVDASGKRSTAVVDVLVRGVLPRRPPGDEGAAPK
jgi:copper(I)-binding protein